MHEPRLPLDHSELSPEDLEVLRMFHETDFTDEEARFGAFPTSPLPSQPPGAEPTTSSLEDDMLAIFASEADEDIATMRQALHQLEQDDRADSPGFSRLQRTAHKLRGTAAAIGCDVMSAIAHHIETVIKLVQADEVTYLTGLIALSHAVGALEKTLQSVVTQGQESMVPLQELEKDYDALNIPLHAASAPGKVEGDQGALPGTPGSNPEAQLAIPTVRVDPGHLDQLLLHTEQLLEQQTPLDNAQKQVETALRELHTAQARLRRIETLFSTISVSPANVNNAVAMYEEQPPSSLVARILHEAAQRTGHMHQLKNQPLPQPVQTAEAELWDEMEIDRFTETHVLRLSLSEAIADVSTATAQLQAALAQFNALVKHFVTKANIVRNDVHLLRTVPFSLLAQAVQQAVQKIAEEQKCAIQFEAAGEKTELDQDIVEALAEPLFQLIRSNVAEGLHAAAGAEQGHHIWFHAHTAGNEVTIEISFSMPISGGALDALYQSIQHLHASIDAQRNEAGNMNFRLRFPRSQGVVPGLLVRAGNQRVLIPFAQVQRIDYPPLADEQGNSGAWVSSSGPLYVLNTLLGFPAGHISTQTFRPVLVLSPQKDTLQVPQPAVQVDEIIGQMELVMKPIASYLRRPGIAGMATDGAGNVLLVLDLSELIRQYESGQHHEGVVSTPGTMASEDIQSSQPPEHPARKVLIADDSVYIRQSLHQTLSRAGYTVLEAHDGIEALEQLGQESPALLLLDIEMPNLNGYDLLSILRARSFHPDLKVVLLTSRSSEKHRQRAKELGAAAYLTKPCPDELLLQTVRSLLKNPA